MRVPDEGTRRELNYGSRPEHFEWIGWKNHRHSVNNLYAQFQTEYSLQDIKDAPRGPRAADQVAVLADERRQRGAPARRHQLLGREARHV